MRPRKKRTSVVSSRRARYWPRMNCERFAVVNLFIVSTLAGTFRRAMPADSRLLCSLSARMNYGCGIHLNTSGACTGLYLYPRLLGFSLMVARLQDIEIMASGQPIPSKSLSQRQLERCVTTSNSGVMRHPVLRLSTRTVDLDVVSHQY
jgi:hypothetical protein